MMKRTDTETLISAMRALAECIKSDDGIFNAAIREAADRLEELQAENEKLRNSNNEALAKAVMDFVERPAAAALKSGFIETAEVPITELYQSARNYVKEHYGIETKPLEESALV